VAGLYVSLTLPPTSLFVFFIGGFLASRSAYLVGALLGAFDALLYTVLFLIVPSAFSDTQLQDAGLNSGQVAGEPLSSATLAPLWGIAILVGILAAAFAAWYRRFLRSSQERAKANRAQREQEQALKAKEQARADKAARKAR
jgi:membrane protein implicated in regulation of membrane protease activity